MLIHHLSKSVINTNKSIMILSTLYLFIELLRDRTGDITSKLDHSCETAWYIPAV